MFDYDLERFVQAQRDSYERALSEIKAGCKRSHWMWYIFPQFYGLGFSPASKRYSIRSLGEAEAYLQHPVLGPRLIECAQAVAVGRRRFGERHLRLAGRLEAAFVRDAVRPGVAAGLGISPGARQVFPGRAGPEDTSSLEFPERIAGQGRPQSPLSSSVIGKPPTARSGRSGNRVAAVIEEGQTAYRSMVLICGQRLKSEEHCRGPRREASLLGQGFRRPLRRRGRPVRGFPPRVSGNALRMAGRSRPGPVAGLGCRHRQRTSCTRDSPLTSITSSPPTPARRRSPPPPSMPGWNIGSPSLTSRFSRTPQSTSSPLPRRCTGSTWSPSSIEVRRVSRPGGVLAVWWYAHLWIEEEEIDSVLGSYHRETVGPCYWPPERAQVEGGYRGIPFPFPRILAPRFTMAASWTLPELLGYVCGPGRPPLVMPSGGGRIRRSNWEPD